MAQQQQNITIAAPGFQGINTEDSPLQQDPGFALVADNAVVDQYGRIGAREAFASYTTTDNISYSAHASMDTETKYVYRLGQGNISGTLYVLGTVGHLQYNSAGALVQEDYYIVQFNGTDMDAISYPTLATPASLRNAAIVYFNDDVYIFSDGNAPLVYNGTTITKLSADAGYLPPQDDGGTIAAEINGEIATAAAGRLWVTGVADDYNTIYYSDLLIAAQWYDGKAVPTDAQNTAGLLDVSEFWPTGGDSIISIQEHNNFLVVFGRESILLYANLNAADPAGADGIFLQDTISGIGCVNRDAVASIGTDILFVDDSGVRSLGRTIQEKSVPIGDLTANVRQDITEAIINEPNLDISLVYIPNKNITVCLFSDTEQAYVMEMRRPSPTSGLKITRWTNCAFKRGLYVEEGDTVYTLLAGKQGGGALQYNNYLEHTGEPYQFKYESNSFTFGNSVAQKFVKQVDFTIASSFIDSPAVVKWGYGSALDYTANKTIIAQTPALFNVDEFNVGTFGEGLTTFKRYRTNTKGSGAVVRVGLEASIAGNGCSIQEINIQTLLGRIY